MPIDPGLHFQNYKNFLEYFWFYLLATAYMKKQYYELLFICEVTVTKVNFRFNKQLSEAATRVIYKRVIFLRNAGILF